MSFPWSTFVPLCNTGKVLHPAQGNGLCADGTRAKLLSAVFCFRLGWEREAEGSVCPSELEAVYHSLPQQRPRAALTWPCARGARLMPPAPRHSSQGIARALLLPQGHSPSSLPFLSNLSLLSLLPRKGGILSFNISWDVLSWKRPRKTIQVQATWAQSQGGQGFIPSFSHLVRHALERSTCSQRPFSGSVKGCRFYTFSSLFV